MKQKIVVIVGPTATGKTWLSVNLAKIFDGEIISGDSMQIYKEMSIGTAKVTAEEMMGVPHHLVDFLSVKEEYNVSDFVKMAGDKIKIISKKNHLPIIVGGTGLYIDSLVNGISFSEEQQDTELRESLRKIAEQKGGEYLLGVLREFDPKLADNLHPGDIGRIIRGIEIYKKTGVTMTEQIKNSKPKEKVFDALIIGLNYKNREKLYSRINERVDIMASNGLVDEVRKVREIGPSKTAEKSIGYKEILPYLDGEQTIDEALVKLKQNSRRYAKRQLTWFRRNENINWIYIDDKSSKDEILQEAKMIIYDFIK